jgi:hypothetical protein
MHAPVMQPTAAYTTARLLDSSAHTNAAMIIVRQTAGMDTELLMGC